MLSLTSFTSLLLLTTFAHAEYKYIANLKLIDPNEMLKKRNNINGTSFDTKFAEGKAAKTPRDNGGNYGDLVYKNRQNGDTLLLREVIISEVLYSNNQDIRWTVSINSARITSVRVLNFGRERAYCLRIDVAAGDAEVVLRISSLEDPRVMIEIYGY